MKLHTIEGYVIIWTNPHGEQFFCSAAAKQLEEAGLDNRTQAVDGSFIGTKEEAERLLTWFKKSFEKDAHEYRIAKMTVVSEEA